MCSSEAPGKGQAGVRHIFLWFLAIDRDQEVAPTGFEFRLFDIVSYFGLSASARPGATRFRVIHRPDGTRAKELFEGDIGDRSEPGIWLRGLPKHAGVRYVGVVGAPAHRALICVEIFKVSVYIYQHEIYPSIHPARA